MRPALYVGSGFDSMRNSFYRDKWPHPIRCRKRHRMQDNTRRSGRDTGCPSRNSSRRNDRFSTRSSQSVGRYMPRAVRSSCAGSLNRNRHRRFPPGCPLGDEAPNSIRTLPSGHRQARIDRYRKYRQQTADSYLTTNLVGVTQFADTPGAMDSMACRETTACREKWGEQWSSSRVHRAGRVDQYPMKGLRCRLSLNT